VGRSLESVRTLSRVLLTGAGGFVGRALTTFLHQSRDSILAVARGTKTVATSGVQTMHIADIRTANWEYMLEGVDAVIHLAARAHVLRERNSDPLAEFRAINVQPAIDLFRACQTAAVERFIFVSSIGVNGKRTDGRSFTEADFARPCEPYAISKWEAEESLRALLVRGSTNLIVVRPSLIYGPYAKGNFLKLMRWIDAGWPLPFAASDAKRNFLGLTSFCDLLKKCLTSPFESEQLFVAADRRSVSTHELISALAGAMNIKVKQTRVPIKLLSLLAKTIGRGAEFERMTTSLEIDSTRAATILGWKSNSALSADLQDMVDVYLRTKNDTQ
jgi:nucleoside-diphosphate-sugar epimerase